MIATFGESTVTQGTDGKRYNVVTSSSPGDGTGDTVYCRRVYDRGALIRDETWEERMGYGGQQKPLPSSIDRNSYKSETFHSRVPLPVRVPRFDPPPKVKLRKGKCRRHKQMNCTHPLC